MSFHDGTSFKMKKVLMVGYQVEIGIIDIHQQGIGEKEICHIAVGGRHCV